MGNWLGPGPWSGPRRALIRLLRWPGINQGDRRDVPLELWRFGIIAEAQRQDGVVPADDDGFPPAFAGVDFIERTMFPARSSPSSRQARCNGGVLFSRPLLEKPRYPKTRPIVCRIGPA